MRTEVNNGIKPLETRLDKLEQGQVEIIKEIRKLRKDLKITGTVLDLDIVHHPKRIDRIDDHLDLTHLPRPL